MRKYEFRKKALIEVELSIPNARRYSAKELREALKKTKKSLEGYARGAIYRCVIDRKPLNEAMMVKVTKAKVI